MFSVATVASTQVLPLLPGAVYAQDGAEAKERVCENALGCEIPKQLPPPKRVFKDIFEEERELARQRDEAAEKARAEARAGVLKLVDLNFKEIKKGRDDFKREIGEALIKVEANADDASAWDDVRRMSRLYDTGLRKDGMYPAADRMKKARVDFDRKTSDELCKALNSSLKKLDASAKKKDAAASRANFEEALASLESWFALQPTP